MWQITLPLVRPYLVAIVLLRAIDAFKVFDTIYILTGGGPGTATEMLTFYAYVAGFRPFNMGFTATDLLGHRDHHVDHLLPLPARVPAHRGGLTWRCPPAGSHACVSYAVLVAWGLFTLFPLYWTFITSVKAAIGRQRASANLHPLGAVRADPPAVPRYLRRW